MAWSIAAVLHDIALGSATVAAITRAACGALRSPLPALALNDGYRSRFRERDLLLSRQRPGLLAVQEYFNLTIGGDGIKSGRCWK